MSPLDLCCLFIIRFQSDLGSQMALCGCSTLDSFRQVSSKAFAHPLFSRLDDSSRHERIAQALERALLTEAGVATASSKAKEDNFFIENTDDPVRSAWIELVLVGKINARKARVIETVLRSWLEEIFPGAHCALPAPRPVPLGNQADMGALGAGWRAEAGARGCVASPAVPISNVEAFADPAEDGFPVGTKSRRKK
jgi:hypothetical protein